MLTNTLGRDEGVYWAQAATFTLEAHKAGSGGGTITANPVISCAADECSGDFADPTEVTLTATPGANSTFAGWSGDCTGTGACTVRMSGPREVTATFDTVPPTPPPPAPAPERRRWRWRRRWRDRARPARRRYRERHDFATRRFRARFLRERVVEKRRQRERRPPEPDVARGSHRHAHLRTRCYGDGHPELGDRVRFIGQHGHAEGRSGIHSSASFRRRVLHAARPHRAGHHRRRGRGSCASRHRAEMERKADNGRLSLAGLLDEGLFRNLARNGRVAQGHSSVRRQTCASGGDGCLRWNDGTRKVAARACASQDQVNLRNR
jgi:Divergent InlB B-repeat domain